MYVIGTAGHVDHGKSTLVKALTDIDPDRLPEEKEREMTVDLGFAWMTLPSGREVSIVDVPGHERFIKNMLAGVGAIDLALLIVAADESVMPQTREHLAILDLLRIRRGLVVITKTDLVDEELVELVKAEVEDVLDDTAFAGCQMVAVSAYSGDGIDELKATIDDILNDTESRRDLGRPRLPVDRCFTVSGFGTVVTGTLIDGSVAVGQQIELAPSGTRARIRGLQSHKSRMDAAAPGVRLALNLSGVSRDEVLRGEVLTNPGWLRPTRRFDANLRMVKGAPHALKHNEGVTFHLFTSETTGRVRLLDADRLQPGAEGWVQVLLDEPIPMVKGDFFVLRSSEDTLGGGQIADPNPTRRHRRFAPEVLERLTMLDAGASEDVIFTVADQMGPCDLSTLSQRSNLADGEVLERLGALVESGEVVALGEMGVQNDAVVYSRRGWDILRNQAQIALQAYHNQYPLRRGAPPQELRSRLRVSQPVYLRAAGRLAEEGVVVDDDGLVRAPEHQAELTERQQADVATYLAELAGEPWSPPTDKPVDPELLAYLQEKGEVVKVNETVVFTTEAYDDMVNRIVAHLEQNGSVTVAAARELFGTSRKYVLPLLEYLDQQRVTRRVDDERVLR
ncbi:MAG: selenocysteine-specific translation elongation factor [Chloroflexota bacterium]|nr:selenocysteine-specific translation elongation factor [Chloroflexota bacterium]MDE2684652.1 selenocysteine-specific translation elongation factor [Chloroflexota bacterium]